MTHGKPFPSVLLLSTAAVAFACAPADQGGEPADAAEAAEPAAEVTANPRFGVWQLESDRPPPNRNVMTYEPYGDGGMKITVASTNAEGETSEWGYATMFDGEFHPVEGQENATTAVEVVDDRTTESSTPVTAKSTRSSSTCSPRTGTRSTTSTVAPGKTEPRACRTPSTSE